MNLQHIGQRIFHIRTEITGLSQREFVRRMGMSQSKISLIEKGQSLPGCFFLYCLHITYGINLNWLVTGNGEMKQPVPQPAAGRDMPAV